MTHARKKASFSQCGGESWSYGETVGGSWPARSLREVKAQKGMMTKVKSRALENTWRQYKGRSQCSMKTLKIQKNETNRSKHQTQRKQRIVRKLYPLRGRSGSKNEALSCHVLLTRMDGCEVNSNQVLEHKTILKSNKTTVKIRETLKTETRKAFAQEPRKRRLASLNAEAVNSLLLEKTEGPSAGKQAKKRADGATDTCRKAKTQEKSGSEWSLFAPTPRRLAGLNAAALLKLTSSTSAHKQRLKSDHKSVSASARNSVHDKPKGQKSTKQSRKRSEVKGGCEVCKSGSFKSKVKFEETPEQQRLTKPLYQSQSMLGYPLKVIKEEQIEAELSPCYCCSSEGSVDYCHRLALFLGQKSYDETEDHPVTSVKHKCLIPPSTLTHPALTVSAHPCLCADPCYSGYYVHISHPAAAAGLSALPFCPREVSGAKLLTPSVSHASAISHSAFCSSSCFHEACRVNGCTFRSIRPMGSRTCSYSSSCSHCTHPIKTEGYSSCEEDQKSRLLTVSRLNSSSAAVPRLISTHTDGRVKECPQNSKASAGSLAVSHTRLSQKPPTAATTAGVKPKKVNRRRVTNGWRPVGVPTEREVFIAGDDETVLRQCYEGVERDGEVIRVRDTVLLRSGPRKKSLPYVAKISSLWEEPRTGELMMSLFWYYRPEHTQGGRDPSMHCENEIFASRHQDENSVACIEDRCYVLPLAQYCRFYASVKRRSEGVTGSVPAVLCPSDSFIPPHRLVPDDVDPDLVYLCRHVYDFRFGRILKNLQ